MPVACGADVGAGLGIGAADLQIAGLVPLSTVDWPGRLVATLFCQGCPWRCGYCHNTAILDPRTPGEVPWERVEALLARRRGLLDGVVLSGGEATMQHAVLPAARRVRELGFAVGLHTGGAFPERLRALLDEGLLDWVGFDVKASAPGYDAIVGRGHAWENAERSLRLLLDAGIDHELRMTVTPALIEQIPAVLEMLGAAGASALVLQRARPDGAPAAFAAQLDAVADWPARFDAAVEAARAAGRRLGVEVSSR
ncbi:anaerobic ribonucleoside-triphosphate reductase activating protein [Brachybacterium nesterenkovii]|nr:anaerobic ribonucleoside-triphosphate reductase activating protein [Brachybacterium nesterenkovii]